MKRFSAMTYATAAWLVCMVAALVVVLTFPPLLCAGGAGHWAAMAIFALTFPANFVNFIIAGIFEWLDFHPFENFGSQMVVSWAIVFTAGWWQWFVAVPWLWRKWKQRARWKQWRQWKTVSSAALAALAGVFVVGLWYAGAFSGNC